MANGSGAGRTGKSFNDRVLAAEVRTLTLTEIKQVLMRNDLDDFKKALLLKLSTNILPRLNEHTGAGGGAIEVSGVEVSVRRDES